MTTNTNTNPWWTVYYNATQASVNARLNPQPQTGSFSVQAGSSAEANAIVTNAHGNVDITITRTSGPFATKAAAITDSANNKKAIDAASQAGSIPNPLDLFHGLNLATWIKRIGEILLGIVLIGVGVAHMTGADNVIAGAVRTGAKAAVLA